MKSFKNDFFCAIVRKSTLFCGKFEVFLWYSGKENVGHLYFFAKMMIFLQNIKAPFIFGGVSKRHGNIATDYVQLHSENLPTRIHMKDMSLVSPPPPAPPSLQQYRKSRNGGLVGRVLTFRFRINNHIRETVLHGLI